MSRNKYRPAEILLLVLFSALYFAVTGLLASRRLFWFDELSTLAAARRRASGMR